MNNFEYTVAYRSEWTIIPVAVPDKFAEKCLFACLLLNSIEHIHGRGNVCECVAVLSDSSSGMLAAGS